MTECKIVVLYVIFYCTVKYSDAVFPRSPSLGCEHYLNDYEILRQLPFPVLINPERIYANESIATMHPAERVVNSLTLVEPNGVVPESIFCLKELQYLIIKHMVFTDDILPDSLANLQILRRLEIINTTITKMTNQLTSLKHLYWLTLVNCSLPQLPNLTNLSKVWHIELDHNHLSKLDGLDGDILRLSLSNNLFSEIPTVKMPAYVEELTMNNNPLRNIIKLDSFINLERVDLHNTTITSIPPTINKLQKLEHLDLSYNDLFYLPFNILELNKLNTLFVNNNSFSDQEIETIKTYFNMSHPNITLRI
ncbi:unnamed protein product [Adineta ricciae]|uniref:Uncharacterized protein n=1 Tax=Adineta ricciae TaxID=249248 RepID=A0A815MWF3_ADIRI|nr:unnamed protein product [Adineta ricciae]